VDVTVVCVPVPIDPVVVGVVGGGVGVVVTFKLWQRQQRGNRSLIRISPAGQSHGSLWSRFCGPWF
jgi:hypothetical protein